MLQHAFKEWAVVCQALALGRQALILRKAGIADDHFALEHTRFWLYPTYVHQQRDGIKPEAAPLLEQAERAKPAGGLVRLAHFVEVPGLYQVRDEWAALVLNHLHIWSEDTIRKRFHYRQPGINVLPVRVYRVPEPIEVPETAAYAGCKSWVELERPAPTDGATPVLDDAAFREVLRSLDGLLKPTALA